MNKKNTLERLTTLYIAVFLFLASYGYGQVRMVNGNQLAAALNSSAFFDASSDNANNISTTQGKGLLYPRTDLTQFTTFGGVSGNGNNPPAGNYPTRYDGFIVYNTANSGVAGVGATEGTLCRGFWYYDNPTTTLSGGTWRPSRPCSSFPGNITTLDCTGAAHIGTLTSGIAASGVSTVVGYTGGNGGFYGSQTVTSTGVTGLTATLAAGTLANGNGTLTYTITGTPVGSGTASFAITIGGQSCTFTRTIQASGTVTTLNCAGAIGALTLTAGQAFNGTILLPYTGGSGSSGVINVASTGVTGLTLTGADQALTGTNLILGLSGTPAGPGTASFVITVGGQTCTITRTVSAGGPVVATLDCTGAIHGGTLTSGVAVVAANTSVSYTGGNGGNYSAQSVSSAGVTGLTATLDAGTLANGNGSVVYAITGTPVGSGTASFAITIGGQNCTFTRTVGSPGPGVFTVTDGGTPAGYLGKGLPANSADIAVSQQITVNVTTPGTYTITTNTVNGVTFSTSGTFVSTGAQTVSLIATGTPVNYTVGNATVNYTISGSGSSFGRKVYLPDQNYTGTIRNDGKHRFLYKVITGPGNKEWLQTNLGAHYNQVGHPNFNPEMSATNVDDHLAFGSLFQVGKNSDGHELVTWTSATTATGLSTASTVPAPPYTVADNSGLFYVSTNLMSVYGVRVAEDLTFHIGPGMPCPSGFKVALEGDYPVSSYNGGSTFWMSNPLRLVAPKVYRSAADGSLITYNRRLIRTNDVALFPATSTAAPEFVIEGGTLVMAPAPSHQDRRSTEAYPTTNDQRGSMDGYPVRCVNR